MLLKVAINCLYSGKKNSKSLTVVHLHAHKKRKISVPARIHFMLFGEEKSEKWND
jgi:hypothetical protein